MRVLFVLLALLATPTPPPGEVVTPLPRPRVSDVRLRNLAPTVILVSWASTEEVCLTREREHTLLGCSRDGAWADVWAQWGDAYQLSIDGTVVARVQQSVVWLPVVSR